LNSDGSLIATASDKGTLIRIFKTDDGTFLQELRRGKEKADINSICFHPNSKLVSSSSDRGTIHIWSLGNSMKKLTDAGEINSSTFINEEKEKEKDSIAEADVPKNQTSILSGLPNILGGKYFKSEWSFAQLRIEDNKSVCTFGPNNTIIVMTSSGKYYQASYDVGKKNSECILIQEFNLYNQNGVEVESKIG
jgi:WD40 repeat protein